MYNYTVIKIENDILIYLFQATLRKLEDASAHITLQTGSLYKTYYGE